MAFRSPAPIRRDRADNPEGSLASVRNAIVLVHGSMSCGCHHPRVRRAVWNVHGLATSAGSVLDTLDTMS